MITNNLSKKNKGFTLVETLVAIAILLVAVVGPISLIGDAVHNIYYVKDEMIAINLAQEAIEAVRQVRDSNQIAGVAWLTGLAVDDYSVDVGKLITGAPVLTACPGACTPQPVFFDTSTGLYRQGIGDVATPFSREVEISDDIASPYQRKVTAVVNWNTGGQTGTIRVSESIFNWQP